MAYNWERARARNLGPAADLRRMRVPMHRRLLAVLRGQEAPRYTHVVKYTEEGTRIQRYLDRLDPKDIL